MMKYKRVLLKLSGEALQGKSGNIDEQRIMQYIDDIRQITALQVEVAIVIGGGNIFRGLKGIERGFDRVKGDYMGMLATVINGLALQSAFETRGIKARVFSSIRMEPVVDYYQRDQVLRVLDNGEVVIFAGGTGNPFFTTDTTAALRGVEINADCILKGTRVDGIYSDDPEINPDAVKYNEITFDEAYQKQLKIMDLTAFTMCQENNVPIIVFDMNKPGNLKKIIEGENIGSIVKK